MSGTLKSFPGSPTLQTEVRTRLVWWWRGTACKTRPMGSGLSWNYDVGHDNLPLLSSYLQVFCRGEHRGSLWTLVPLRRPRLAAQADNWRVLCKWTMQDRLKWLKFVMCLWKLLFSWTFQRVFGFFGPSLLRPRVDIQNILRGKSLAKYLQLFFLFPRNK